MSPSRRTPTTAPSGVAYRPAREAQISAAGAACAGADTERAMAATSSVRRTGITHDDRASPAKSRPLARPCDEGRIRRKVRDVTGAVPVVSGMSTNRTTTALLGVVLAAAVAAPASAAGPQIDPAIYDAEIPAGLVEHGVVDTTITGSPAPLDDRTEYWASGDRWRSITKDRSDGTLLREAWGDATRTTYFTHARRPQPGVRAPKGAPSPDSAPRLIELDRRATPPLAGWTAAYNRKLVQKGLLSPLAAVNVAGIAGTLYVVPQERKSTDPAQSGEQWVTDDTGSRTEIALEDGTFAPLVRQTSKENNGEYGTFVQREELVSRERSTDDAALRAKLSTATQAKALKAFKAKVKAFKARSKR